MPCNTIGWGGSRAGSRSKGLGQGKTTCSDSMRADLRADLRAGVTDLREQRVAVVATEPSESERRKESSSLLDRASNSSSRLPEGWGKGKQDREWGIGPGARDSPSTRWIAPSMQGAQRQSSSLTRITTGH